MKKFFKMLCVFTAIAIFGFASLWYWSFTSIEETKAKAIPFIQQNMPLIMTWDAEQFSEILTPEALAIFQSERGKKISAYLSTIGKLVRHDEPEFVQIKSSVNTSGNGIELAIFRVPALFENGSGLLTIMLVEENGEYLFHHIQLNSDFFIK
ncbi:hypothetical protein [Enterovibrio baiacu]|uniref:hypothetical protein n=1 Tax=Enterovibrio baiacu TaxID=2491023 RepID=UPI001012E31A|nr:hypothetical protein [Enterovibrio baiacu]MBE1275522.1 hypothetical protein [Enterovibrio baiacu]